MASLALGVKFNATSSGLGDFVDASNATGYARGSGNLVDGKTYRYRAESADLTQWEWGSGIWTAATNTLARTTITLSSTGAKVSFSAAPFVGVVPFPADILQFDDPMSLTAAQKVQAQLNIGAREILTAARTYYVRVDGSDSNTGLVDSAGGGFLTVAKALAVVAALDCSTFVATVQIDAGTWTVPVVLPRTLGTAVPVLTGVGSTTILSMTSNDCITNDGSGVWQVNNLKLTTTTSGNGMTLRNGGVIKFSGVEFGTIAGHGAACFAASAVQATGAFSVSGNASSICFGQGYINTIGQTLTFSNSPVFSLATFYCFGGYMDVYSMTFVNGATVTGKRYDVEMTGAIFTNGGGATYIPGSVAGTLVNGGVYG